jgi:hypothetical protein
MTMKRHWQGIGVALLTMVAAGAHAQGCTTQAKMAPGVRTSLADAALAIGNDIKSGNATKVQGEAIAEYASNFGSATQLIQSTAQKVGGDQLKVTQLYLLDARNRAAGATDDADFSCPLTGGQTEVNFSINGLPPGMYGFAMIDASGDRPWLISMLLRQDAGKWKIAGLYPHARTAVAHDGVWYWNKARDDAKGGKKWSAWMHYAEADNLLRPSNFVSSNNLDKLREEQHTAAPPELANGISEQTPMTVKGPDGKSYKITSLGSDVSQDGQRLNLVLHYAGDPAVTDGPAENAQNTAAAAAVVGAHAELRDVFDNVLIFDDVQGRQPFVTEVKLDAIH